MRPTHNEGLLGSENDEKLDMRKAMEAGVAGRILRACAEELIELVYMSLLSVPWMK